MSSSASQAVIAPAEIPEGVRIRLDPEDEAMHELGPEEHFNESMYFNFLDPSTRLGGWVRLGNRANQGYAERTICLYLPDGTVAFDYARPEIADNDSFNAGGLSFDVVEPFKALEVKFSGETLLLADGFAMTDPKKAYTESPRVPVTIDFRYEGVSPMLGGEPEYADGTPLPDAHGGDFARGHYEQHVVATGPVTIGDQSFEVTGPGLRDHSWGPRHWQSPWWYRWITGNFGADAGFVASIIAKQDGSRSLGGVVFRNGVYEQVYDVQLTTTWDDATSTQTGLEMTLTTAEGSYTIRGEVIGMVPLRNRRVDENGVKLTTRIAEGLTVWHCEQLGSEPGGGMSEYLDQIIDGRPVGRDEESVKQ